jgi:uncharacterized protein (UPF0264 family)
MKLLVSVRDVDEALAAASAGADLVDLKEPRKGALGGLPPEHIGLIVASLREAGWAGPISATIGDWSMDDPHGIVDRVTAVGERGVTYVKVGVEPAATTPVVLDVLASCGHAVVPVFIADRGLDLRLVERTLARGFPAVMVDTADKRAGSLFDLARPAELRAFIDQARAAGAMVGLAGALQRQHLAALQALAPDFAGFRSAVCGASRESTFEPARLQALRAALLPATSVAR